MSDTEEPEVNKEVLIELGLVDTFMEKMEIPKDPDLWKRLINEELDELDEALEHLLKEVCDVKYVAAGGAISGLQLTDVDDGALVSRLQRAHVLAVVFDQLAGSGFVHESFWRVHLSNMSKLGEDGKPIRREDGKILKGPNYQPPNLKELLALS